MRINKYLSACGIWSRREADRLIAEGKVTVNGIRAAVGQEVSQSDLVEVCGKKTEAQTAEVYLAVNKPRGVVVTTDRKFQDPVLEDLVPKSPRVFAVGRLDKDSEGLILMTNNGEVSNQIQKARYHHEKEYEVEVDHALTRTALERMEQGVFLEELGRKTRPCRIHQTGLNRFTIVLTEGMNRQIRRMCAAMGYRVTSLRRIRVMNILLGDLPSGAYRPLSQEEIRVLKSLLAHSSGSAAHTSSGGG